MVAAPLVSSAQRMAQSPLVKGKKVACFSNDEEGETSKPLREKGQMLELFIETLASPKRNLKNWDHLEGAC